METCKRSRILLAVGLAVLGLLLTRGAPSASADTTDDFNLTGTNLTGSLVGPGPYLSVHISLDDQGTATFRDRLSGRVTDLLAGPIRKRYISAEYEIGQTRLRRAAPDSHCCRTCSRRASDGGLLLGCHQDFS
jgi:hypothetical protein